MKAVSLTWVVFALLLACGAEEPAPSEVHTTLLQTLKFAREEPTGVSAGLDLDLFQSGPNDGRSCNKVDFLDPEGRPGIDNELGRLLPLVDLAGEGALEGLIQGAINEGRMLLLVEATETEPGTLSLTARRGSDTPLLGTDGRILAGQTVALSAEDPLLGTGTAHLGADGYYQTEPFRLRLPIIVFSILYVVDLPKAIMRFRYGEQGEITGGLVAGGIPVEQLVTILRQASEFGGDFEGLFGDALKGSADLDRDPAGVCTATSMAAVFDAVPAFMY